MECGTSSKKRLRRSGGRRFAHRLALKLGHIDVDRMLRQISIRQLNEWRAYADLEPFDEERADLRAASIVQALVNPHRRKGSPPVALKDCVLRFGDEEATTPVQTREQAQAQVRQTMDVLMAIYNKPQPKKRARP